MLLSSAQFSVISSVSDRVAILAFSSLTPRFWNFFKFLLSFQKFLFQSLFSKFSTWHLPQNIPNCQKPIFCNKCNFYVHIKCNDISVSEYQKSGKEPNDVPWFCKLCVIYIFPLGSLMNEELLELKGSVSSSMPCTCRLLVCLCCRHFHGP